MTTRTCLTSLEKKVLPSGNQLAAALQLNCQNNCFERGVRNYLNMLSEEYSLFFSEHKHEKFHFIKLIYLFIKLRMILSKIHRI